MTEELGTRFWQTIFLDEFISNKEKFVLAGESPFTQNDAEFPSSVSIWMLFSMLSKEVFTCFKAEGVLLDSGNSVLEREPNGSYFKMIILIAAAASFHAQQ